MSDLPDDVIAEILKLTDIERLCLSLVLEGAKTPVIAMAVGRSNSWVDKRFSTISQRLRAPNRRLSASMVARFDAGRPENNLHCNILSLADARERGRHLPATEGGAVQRAALIYMKDDPMDAFVRSANCLLIASWTELERVAAPAPNLSWEDWKEALLSLIETPEQELLVRGALAAVMKTATRGKEAVTLTRLLTLAKRLGDSDLDFPFSPRPLQSSEEDDMP